MQRTSALCGIGVPGRCEVLPAIGRHIHELLSEYGRADGVSHIVPNDCANRDPIGESQRKSVFGPHLVAEYKPDLLAVCSTHLIAV